MPLDLIKAQQLLNAVRDNRVDLATELLGNPPVDELVNFRGGFHGAYLITEAIGKSDLAMVTLLLNKGARVNDNTVPEYSPLACCLFSYIHKKRNNSNDSRLEIIVTITQLLVERDAWIDIEDDAIKTAIKGCCSPLMRHLVLGAYEKAMRKESTSELFNQATFILAQLTESLSHIENIEQFAPLINNFATLLTSISAALSASQAQQYMRAAEALRNIAASLGSVEAQRITQLFGASQQTLFPPAAPGTAGVATSDDEEKQEPASLSPR